METRSYVVNEGKFYLLFMNPVFDRAESRHLVAASENYDMLISWYNNQRCDMYEDGSFRKQFKKGSKLECYNSISTFELNPDTLFGHGIYEYWVQIDSSGIPEVKDIAKVLIK